LNWPAAPIKSPAVEPGLTCLMLNPELLWLRSLLFCFFADFFSAFSSFLAAFFSVSSSFLVSAVWPSVLREGDSGKREGQDSREDYREKLFHSGTPSGDNKW
jgi:hypothetical protein